MAHMMGDFDLAEDVDQDLVVIRDLVVKDPVAVRKWSQVVDHIVNCPGDQQRIKKLLKNTENGDLSEGVLECLRIWYALGDERPNLLDIVRNLGMNILADRIWARLIRINCASGVWFHDTDLIRERNEYLRRYTIFVHCLLTGNRSQELSDVNVAALVGSSGIGKSSLAWEYAHEYRDYYGGNVLCINAKSKESMMGSFTRLAKHLGIRSREPLGEISQQPKENIVQNVYSKFSRKKCLFVFDNVNDLEDVRMFMPKVKNPSSYFLLTSRRMDLAMKAGQQLNLDALNLSEAIK